MYDLIVIGGGPAGMMAAGIAADRGQEVLLLEKKGQLGKKLAITGKGRCNLTNDCSVEEIINNFSEQGDFLYSTLYSFSNWQLRDFFADLGVETKVERGDRVFPVSDSAKDVVQALEKFMTQAGVEVKLNSSVTKLLTADQEVTGVQLADGSRYRSANVLVAVGGKAYPTTGSTGDGYDLAQQVGHTITEIKPSLVPLETKEDWVPEAQGLKLKNVTATLMIDGEAKKEEFGELLFTHFGITGPIVLTLSRDIAQYLGYHSIKLKLDLKPALSQQKLDARLQRDFEKYSRKQFKNSLDDLLPSKLRPIVVDLVSIPATKFVNQITTEERRELVELLTNLELTVIGTRGFKKAIVTQGGVDTDQLDPTTLESKLVEGLYFAGEVIDIDAYTGGFNLQAAFSTGYVVGNKV
ncbi:BaiN/RdsA family NAD(P)/FAD-dependent oxidoreductase [Halanaerobaculum tunisiense]